MRVARLLTFSIAVLAAGCGGTPAQPTTPTLTISCPAALTLPTADGSAVPGSFAAPAAAGGKAPVLTSCDRASGTTFPLGTTQVTCTAKDGSQRTASCSFGVSVVRVPRLLSTKFVAFGDSITEGQVDTPCPSSATSFANYRQLLQSHPTLFDPQGTYVAKLQALMSARYIAQTVGVFNAGLGGETAADGKSRLPLVLSQQPTDGLVLLEGANDIDAIFFGTPAATAISSAVEGLRSMVRGGRQRGLPVFVGTLLPQRAGACRGYAPANIADANAAIRPMVAAEGATLVDLYAAFGGAPGDLIGPDGLHPSDAGHQRIADTFFAAIRAQLER
jgi:lysophospholipase L1-like esterase